MTVRRLEDEPKSAQPCRCGGCGHVWIVCYLPMPITECSRLLKGARCPMCAGGRLYLLDTCATWPLKPVEPER